MNALFIYVTCISLFFGASLQATRIYIDEIVNKLNASLIIEYKDSPKFAIDPKKKHENMLHVADMNYFNGKYSVDSCRFFIIHPAINSKVEIDYRIFSYQFLRFKETMVRTKKPWLLCRIFEKEFEQGQNMPATISFDELHKSQATMLCNSMEIEENSEAFFELQNRLDQVMISAPIDLDKNFSSENDIHLKLIIKSGKEVAAIISFKYLNPQQ